MKRVLLYMQFTGIFFVRVKIRVPLTVMHNYLRQRSRGGSVIGPVYIFVCLSAGLPRK